MLERWYLQCISCKEWEAFGNVSYCTLAPNSAENRQDHCHHFHQRGNGSREFVTCSRSHTEHGAELLGAELSPAHLVLQPQEDLSKRFVLGTSQRYFALWGIVCSASLHRKVTSLSLLNTRKEHQRYNQMGVKVSENVHLQVCKKTAAPQIYLPCCGMGWVLPLLCNIYFIDKVCLLQAFGNLCHIEKFWPKYRFFFNFLKTHSLYDERGGKECSSDYYTVLHLGLSWSIIPAPIRAKGITQ